VNGLLAHLCRPLNPHHSLARNVAGEQQRAEHDNGRPTVGLCGANRARNHAVEFGLLSENPTSEAADLRNAERLRQRCIGDTGTNSAPTSTSASTDNLRNSILQNAKM